MNPHPSTILTTTDPWPSVEADWLVVGIPETGELPSGYDPIAELVHQLRESRDFSGKLNEQLPIFNVPSVTAKRLLLAGLGNPEQCSRSKLIDWSIAVGKRLATEHRSRIAVRVPTDQCHDETDLSIAAVGSGLLQGTVGPGLYKQEATRTPPDEILLIIPSGLNPKLINAGDRYAQAEGGGVTIAREWVNRSPLELYPESFAQRAHDLFEDLDVDVTSWDEDSLRDERMGAILGVAQGSERPPRLLILRYHGAPGRATLGLIGKGVTFDSGGLSLKPNDSMVDMKCDMAGAAAVVGATWGIATLEVPVNLLCLVPLVENMPSGKALKLGDVITARNGKTVEVLNTDAEGRLILADALAYAAEQEVARMVDLATLTGACMVALGTDISGLMSNDAGWSAQVEEAAKRMGERVWRLPLDELGDCFDEALKSDVADLKNVGGNRYGGAIVAAKFLQQFVGEIPWAHLDIAGPAWADKDSPTHDAGGTGFGVRTLISLAESFSTSPSSIDRSE